MKTFSKIGLLVIVLTVGMLLSACSIDVERNTDGSLNATVVMTEAQMQDELVLALAERNTQVTDVTADMKSGNYIDVTFHRQRENSDQVDEVAFRMDLSVTDGHLGVTISGITVNGQPAQDERAEQWSERIATRLENWSNRGTRRTLTSVTVDENNLTMIYRIETNRSQDN